MKKQHLDNPCAGTDNGFMKTTHFNVIVQREDDWYVAQCVDNFVASQGQSVEEALANLKEALELYYENELL